MAYTGPFLCASLCLSYLNVLTHLSPMAALWGVYQQYQSHVKNKRAWKHTEVKEVVPGYMVSLQ